MTFTFESIKKNLKEVLYRPKDELLTVVSNPKYTV